MCTHTKSVTVLWSPGLSDGIWFKKLIISWFSIRDDPWQPVRCWEAPLGLVLQVLKCFMRTYLSALGLIKYLGATLLIQVYYRVSFRMNSRTHVMVSNMSEVGSWESEVHTSFQRLTNGYNLHAVFPVHKVASLVEFLSLKILIGILIVTLFVLPSTGINLEVWLQLSKMMNYGLAI